MYPEGDTGSPIICSQGVTRGRTVQHLDLVSMIRDWSETWDWICSTSKTCIHHIMGEREIIRIFRSDINWETSQSRVVWKREIKSWILLLCRSWIQKLTCLHSNSNLCQLVIFVVNWLRRHINCNSSWLLITYKTQYDFLIRTRLYRNLLWGLQNFNSAPSSIQILSPFTKSNSFLSSTCTLICKVLQFSLYYDNLLKHVFFRKFEEQKLMFCLSKYNCTTSYSNPTMKNRVCRCQSDVMNEILNKCGRVQHPNITKCQFSGMWSILSYWKVRKKSLLYQWASHQFQPFWWKYTRIPRCQHCH